MQFIKKINNRYRKKAPLICSGIILIESVFIFRRWLLIAPDNLSSMKQVGLIGIGLVGTSLAYNLLNAGYKVIGYDIDDKQMEKFISMGGTAASSPQDVAAQTETILFSLLRTEIVQEVVEGEDGITKADPLPRVIIDTTTGEPILSTKIGRNLEEMGIAYLDATISGSSVQIKNREGVFMVGGKESLYKESKEIFDTLAADHMYVGSMGNGAKSKLAVNLLVGMHRLVLAEGLVFAEMVGLDLEKTLEIFRRTQAYSRIMDPKGEKMVKGDFATQSRISQHRKDVSLMIKMANHYEKNLLLSPIHLDVLDSMIARGEGDIDTSAVIKEMRRIASKNED